jgi:hypothetical protein
MFQAHCIDNEIMSIEEEIKGIKIVLNITEFLFNVVPIKNLFTTENTSLLITSYVPYSNKPCEINNYNILMNNLLNDNVHYHNGTDGVNFRGFRSIHNCLNGNYPQFCCTAYILSISEFIQHFAHFVEQFNFDCLANYFKPAR